MRSLKVGLVCPYSFSYPGGVQEHVRSLAAFLKNKGARVKILLSRSRVREGYGRDVCLLGGCLTWPVFGSQSNLGFADAAAVRAFLERERFDLLHLHNPFAPFLSWQVLENYTGAVVATLHANVASERNAALPFFLDFANFTLAPRISRFIAVSAVAREVLWKKYRPPTVIIPNGVDGRRFCPSVPPLKKWRDRRLNILYVGRLDERKGLPYLLDAFKILQKGERKVRLLAAGDGALRSACEAKVKREKIRSVKFLGRVKEKDLPSLYTAADIFCSPATHGESFGMVLLEAMASGRPVAAFDIEGYREVLVGPAARFLAPAGEAEGLARVLAELAASASRRREMGEWGRAEVQKKYDWSVVGERILRVYREALAV